ncbi:unnamed protein product, partial [Rotaria sp. Silwood1]
MLSKQERYQGTKDVSECEMIEKKVLSVIQKWLDYQDAEDLQSVVLYAVLQLTIEDSNIRDSIDIIKKMFVIDNEF